MILNNVTIGSGENLDPELATQDDLIAQIAAALEGKTGASGGTSVSCIAKFGEIGVSSADGGVDPWVKKNMIMRVLDGDVIEHNFSTIDLSSYVGKIIVVTGITFSYELYIVPDEYDITIPAQLNFQDDSLYFIVPNCDITINILAAQMG